MFYVKENINDTLEVTVEINDENVFCRCPRCGAKCPSISTSSSAMRSLTSLVRRSAARNAAGR